MKSKATDYKDKTEGRIQFVTVGSNSAENLGTKLKVGRKTNVSSSYTRSAWISSTNNRDRVLTNTSNGVDLGQANVSNRSYLPVFQLDTYNYKIFTLRMDAENIMSIWVKRMLPHLLRNM